jgi:hypothetical protein
MLLPAPKENDMTEFTFRDNATVEDINSVPEKYRGLYAEGEGDNAGKFSIIDAAQGLVGDYIGTQETLAGVRNDKKKVTDENAERRLAVKAIEDFAQSVGLEAGDEGMLAALKVFVDDLQGQIKGGKEIKINMEKVNRDADERVRVVTETKDGELAEMKAALARHLISDAASRALAEHKGSIDLLLPHVLASCKMVRKENGDYGVTVLDAQGDSRFDSAGSLMGVSGLVAEMKTQDKFGRAFESEAAPGAGTTPGSMNRSTARPGSQDMENLSPTQKIAIGLKKGQAADGRGGSTMGGG